MVRSNTRGEVGFLADERRINVAITRARRHLCIVCDRQTCKTNEFLRSFLDYCDKYGQVRSGFDYINDSTQAENTDLCEFESVKFQKLKVSEKKRPITKGEKKPAEKMQTKRLEPVQISTPDEVNFEKSIEAIIDKLRSNTNQLQAHSFPIELGARERRIVHEVAERHGVYHYSVGEGNERFVVISTEANAEQKFSINTAETQQVGH